MTTSEATCLPHMPHRYKAVLSTAILPLDVWLILTLPQPTVPISHVTSRARSERIRPITVFGEERLSL